MFFILNVALQRTSATFSPYRTADAAKKNRGARPFADTRSLLNCTVGTFDPAQLPPVLHHQQPQRGLTNRYRKAEQKTKWIVFGS